MRYDLKSFVECECDTLDVIASKTLAYIDRTISLKERETPWVFLDHKEVLKEIPEYIEYFKKNKLLPQGCACTILYENLPLHIDAPPIIAKMNFPILNTAGWANRWYASDLNKLNSLPPKNDPLGLDNVDVSSLKKEDLTLIADYSNFVKPIILNSQQLHSVERLGNTQVPRVMMTFTFKNDPWERLK